MDSAAEFRFDGGATWLNLLATKGRSFGPRPVERLSTPAAADRWLAQAGFLLTSAASSADLEGIVAVREALREIAMAAIAEREPARAALDVIDAITTPASARSLSAALRDQSMPVEDIIFAIVMQALVTLQGPDRAFLTECAESDCRWVFLDTSGRRHWCPSPACASRGRVRALRARQGAALSE